MTPGIKPLVAGNWKMNGTMASLSELAAMQDGYNATAQEKHDMLVCVPFTLLSAAASLTKDGAINIGAQDCHANASGAHTGDTSVEMITDCGANAIIVGHSERRTDHGENDVIVLAKARGVLEAGQMAVICIGETEAERKGGKTLDVLKAQMAGSIPDNPGSGEIVVAYEPVWAIGTGMTPTASDVEEAHKFMRNELVSRFGNAGSKIRLLYGGSVKPGNASELMGIENVDGALVGGASLKAEDFLGICQAYL